MPNSEERFQVNRVRSRRVADPKLAHGARRAEPQAEFDVDLVACVVPESEHTAGDQAALASLELDGAQRE